MLTLRGQLSQICDAYMHLVELTFWQNSKLLQLMLINRTFYANLHHQLCFYHDFRNNCL